MLFDSRVPTERGLTPSPGGFSNYKRVRIIFRKFQAVGACTVLLHVQYRQIKCINIIYVS